MKKTIGIIGGGNMGGAIIAGISKEYKVLVCEQDERRCRWLKQKYKVSAGDIEAVIEKSNVIILAVKPQNFDYVLEKISAYLSSLSGSDTRSARSESRERIPPLIISIAAGITCRYIEKRLGDKVHVVRTMPNLPVQIGKGITGICPGRCVVNGDLVLASQLFRCIGKTVIVEERLMDAITAVSGSGPAYVFLFIECLNEAAQSLGLDKNLSKELVLQMMKGSLELIEQQREDAGILRAKVTSKGGTTQAAMEVFHKNKIEGIIKTALRAAKKRAKELSK